MRNLFVMDTRDAWQRQFDQARAWNDGAGELRAWAPRHPLMYALQNAWMRHEEFNEAWQSIAAYLTVQTVEDMLEASIEDYWFRLACATASP